ncbi:MAG: NAD(P)-dependent oxidoreductase [Sandaracinaceae bacterium]
MSKPLAVPLPIVLPIVLVLVLVHVHVRVLVHAHGRVVSPSPRDSPAEPLDAADVLAYATRMDTIAVLGLGLLGRGFAQNLLSKGHPVRVWNRTKSRAEALASEGAYVAESPADAVKGAARVHLILTDDSVVDPVIEALRPGLGDGTFVVDHSTNLPAGVATRFARLRKEGVRYIHAPVFMGPQNSKDATGLMLLSGPSEDEATLRPALETMTGKLLYLGAEPQRAATMKLTGNGMLVMLTAAMGDLFAMGRAAGVTPEEVLALFDAFAPPPAMMGKRALGARSKPPGFELTMARKDVRLMIETAGGPDALTVLPAIAATMDRAIDAGDGDKDFAIFAAPPE